MEAVVEFQAFKDNDDNFIIKELAIVGGSLECQILFKPPYGFHHLNSKAQKTNRWLSRNHHGLRWEEGSIPFNEGLISALCLPFQCIYTKGREKAEFLKRFHSDVRVIDGPSIDAMPGIACSMGDHKKCAVRTAYTLQYYLSLSLHEAGQYELGDGKRLVTIVTRTKGARRGDD